jgi:hypothetical protein
LLCTLLLLLLGSLLLLSTSWVLLWLLHTLCTFLALLLQACTVALG